MSKRIYRPESTVQADLLRAILKEHGVDSNLENDDSSQWNHRPVTAPLSISVAEADESRALAILQEHFDRVQKTAGGRRDGFPQRVHERRKSRRATLILFYLVIFIVIVVMVVFLSTGRLGH
jgi:hypothetical protein